MGPGAYWSAVADYEQQIADLCAVVDEARECTDMGARAVDPMSARKQGVASGAPTVHISTWGLLLGPNVTVEAAWEYDAADPWTVTFGVLTGRGWVRWCLDRELLAAGMLAPSGVGDVTVSPFPTGVFVTLRGEEQYAELLVYRADELLARSYEVVPLGAERLDWATEELLFALDDA